MSNEGRGIIVIVVAAVAGTLAGYLAAKEAYRQECTHSHIQIVSGNMYRCFRVETVKQSDR